MARPYSDGLRERVVVSVNAGRSCRASLFDQVYWLAEFREH